MTEQEARAWLDDHVPRETLVRMEAFSELITASAAEHNLISRSTLDMMWSRHFVDSAQLAPLAGDGALLDVGSGAGFPGLVLAMMREDAAMLVEPRRLRAEFLAASAATLGLGNVVVSRKRVETLVAPPFATIVARAVAPLGALLAMADHLADRATRWVLPKGRSAQSELAAARETWHGDFRLVGSVSDPQAAIVVATDVRRR